VQVDPITPTLTAPGTKRLKVRYDGPPSKSAFNFNLRRYTTVRPTALVLGPGQVGELVAEFASTAAGVYAVRVDVDGVTVFNNTLTVTPSAVDPTATTVTFAEAGYVNGTAGYIQLAFHDHYKNRIRGTAAYFCKVPMSTLGVLIREVGRCRLTLCNPC
jgi:hypothetical protein